MRFSNDPRPAHRVTVTAAMMLVAAMLATPAPAGTAPQDQATVQVTVVDAESGEVIAVSGVQVAEDVRASVTGSDGRYRIRGLAAGSYRVVVTAVNYSPRTVPVELRPGETTEIRVELEPRPYEAPRVVVRALRPDLAPEVQADEQLVRESNPKDVGELMRKLPGVDAVRRGPLGLDPVIRGLRETEVGVYLDGTRLFPAGPARMDSALSHFDPGAMKNVEVVKGPYALTWGAGNLSAVRATTQQLPPSSAGALHGNLWVGGDSNTGTVETVGNFRGRRGGTSYWGMGAYRQGDDYDDGDGEVVPADFLSREFRGKLGFEAGAAAYFTLGFGYQQQRDIDYPGRLLDAELFDALHVMGDWRYDGEPDERVRSVTVTAYANDVDHRMNNDEKPTARPAPGRMPPFPLEVIIDTGVNVVGGRAAVEQTAGDDWLLEAGGDVYRANRDAIRTISRRDLGVQLFRDIVWPDADITDAGLFFKAERPFEGVNVSGTVRFDRVKARAGTVSDFFAANTEGPLDRSENNLSAALSVAAPVNQHWVISGGVGSAVRTADASERYSDRFPASKAQTAAEFMGDPGIDPERSTQLDLWIDGRYSKVSVSTSVFFRRIGDYITLEPTDLPRRLPLSPPTVFRYVNGEADFYGVEGSLAVFPVDMVGIRARAEYLRGEDGRLDEPALGVAPASLDLSARYEDPADRFDVEAVAHRVGDQERVATSRGETPTDGYTTFDITGGVRPFQGIELRGGVINAADEFHVNHLNSKNPFTGRAIPEPGRVFFGKLSWSF